MGSGHTRLDAVRLAWIGERRLEDDHLDLVPLAEDTAERELHVDLGRRVVSFTA